MAAARNLHRLLVILVAVVASTTVSAQPNANKTSPAPPPLGDPDLLVSSTTVPYLNTTKVKVCTTPWTPGVTCSPDTDPIEWTGFEIEVFRLTTSRMGITEDMLEWTCYEDKDKLLEDLYSNKCELAAAGMAPKSERIAKGLRFSVPSIRTGFSIMVSRKEQPPGMWYFFSAMSWQVWLLLLITGIVVGVIVWFFELGMRALTADTHQMGRVMWDTMGRPVQMSDYRLSSFPANLTGILWSFLVFILMAIYSANLTANLTINQFKSDIKGLADLPGKAVGSWYGYQDELLKYNIASMGLPWNGPEDEVAMIEKLKSGVINALVFDTNVLEIYDATDCDTMLVGDPFDLRDQCVTFSQNLWRNHPEFTDAFDISMLSVVQGTGGVEELIDRFIKVPPADCKTSDFSTGYTQVTFQQVSGLWVLLSASVLFGALFVIGYKIWQRAKPRLQKRGWFKGTDKVAKSFKILKKSGFAPVKYTNSGRELYFVNSTAGSEFNGGSDHLDSFSYRPSATEFDHHHYQPSSRGILVNGRQMTMPHSMSHNNNNNGGGGGGGGSNSSSSGRVPSIPEIPIITIEEDENEDDGTHGTNSTATGSASGGGGGNSRRVRPGTHRVSFLVGDLEDQR